MSYLQTKGRIFDVQRYSIHDGPGIRTIVFLKGCVLRCRWCCNPESQEYGIQTMKVLGKDKVIGRDVTVEEMIKVVEQDRPYYRRSGGGLTLSGGESLCQPEFARDMLRAAKERGINTALESMACAPFETIETILPYLDPVIPTFNDTVEEIQGIASFADTLPGVEQLHLLPYHRLGQDKYIGLGRPYLMEGILPPTQEHMQTLKKAAESVSSLHVQIGG